MDLTQKTSGNLLLQLKRQKRITNGDGSQGNGSDKNDNPSKKASDPVQKPTDTTQKVTPQKESWMAWLMVDSNVARTSMAYAYFYKDGKPVMLKKPISYIDLEQNATYHPGDMNDRTTPRGGLRVIPAKGIVGGRLYEAVEKLDIRDFHTGFQGSGSKSVIDTLTDNNWKIVENIPEEKQSISQDGYNVEGWDNQQMVDDRERGMSR